MKRTSNNRKDARLAEIIEIIRKFAAGDLAARGTLAGDGSALDGVMAGINNLGEVLETRESSLQLAKEPAERTAAEQELRSANEQLSVLLDSLPIAVYRCAAEGDYAVAYMSQNVVSFTGYTARNFMDQPDLWFSHIHPDDAPRISDGVALLLEKGRHVYEYRWRKADGNYLWIRDSLRRVRFEDDTPDYLVGMWQDITEDTLAAEALRKANDDLSLFRKLLDSSSDAIEVVDQTTLRYLDVNETACRELGYSREELLSLSVHDIDPDMDTDSLFMIGEQLAGSGFARFETTHRRKDGSTFPVEVNMGTVTLEKTYRLGIVRDITEHKQAAEALRQSEAKFRALVETTSDLIWEADRNGHLIYVSPRSEVLLGYKPEEVVGRSPFDFMPPAEVQRLAKAFSKTIAKQVPFAALKNLTLHKDGRVVILETSGVPFFDDNGEFAGYRGIGRDITGSQKAAQALEESERKFRAILDATMDGILVVDVQSQGIVMGNRAICDMLGYELEEFMRLSVADLTPAAALPEVQRQFERTAKGEILMAYELLVQRKDGSVFYADVSGGPPMLLAGRSVMVGVVHDITERKQAEETLRYKNTVLSIQQWISPSAIMVVDENARIVSFNEKFIQMWDLPEELVRAGIDEPVLRKVCEQIENPAAFLARVQYLYEHKDEISHDELLLRDCRIIDRRSSPITDDDGRYYGRVWDFRDITELKRATQKVCQLNDELELKVRERTKQLLDAQDELVRKEKLALLGQVAGSVGHELRNPLGVMNNAVYFLQTVLTDADATTREYLEIIKVEIAEADRIVGDLLDSVRTKPPQPAAVDVRELIDQTLRQNLVPSTMNVMLEIPATLPAVWVDAMQIRQVFRNLIGNGVEAMADGGTLAIRAVENRQDGTVSVSVRDTGCGMPPDVLAKLFQPLFTTKARGIGLGLVVVKNLTEANGGSVGVESVPGEGSRFFVTLPCGKGDSIVTHHAIADKEEGIS